MNKIKLIWDFMGPFGKDTAVHHEKHLREFFNFEKKKLFSSGTESVNESHHIAFAIILKEELEEIKIILKPNEKSDNYIFENPRCPVEN